MIIANEYINKIFLEMYDGLEDVVGLFRPPPSGVIAVVTWSDVYDLHGNHYPNLSQIKHTPVTSRHERLCDTHISEEK